MVLQRNSKLIFYSKNPFISNIPEFYEVDRPFEYLDNLFDIAQID